MKESPIILILLAIISFTGCKRNASETQKTLTSSDSTAVIEQVEKMYNEVFDYYNKRDFKTIKNGKKFFSKKLKTLWEELPVDYAVIDADPWTWTQEPDSFVFQTVKLNRLTKDSAVVKTMTQCFGHFSTKAGDVYDCGISQMTLRLVREDGRWFVDDFRDKDERPHSSLTHMIQDFKREQEASRRVEGSLGNISPKEVHPVSDISKAEFERLYNLFDTGKLPLEEWKKYKDDIIYRDLYSEACSWYCRGNVFSLTASSQLQADKDSAYAAKNAHDSNHESVWIEGGDGQGIGEYLLYEFAGMCPRITTVKVLNGHVKSDKDWRDWSRVKLLKMYYNETDYAILELEDSRTLQCFDVGLLGYNDKNAANWTLKFEILDVYPGEKYEDTVISELYFDGVDVH